MGNGILDKLEGFNKECSENLSGVIDEILKTDKKVNAIGFITTDDFYGFYLTWDYNNSNIYEHEEWEQGLYPDFLYNPLVEAVDSCDEIDFTTKSDEKWNFMECLLTILKENITQIPDEVFYKNNYKREDILFFAAMSDGDYIEEIIGMSIKMFNTPETVKAHRQNIEQDI